MIERTANDEIDSVVEPEGPSCGRDLEGRKFYKEFRCNDQIARIYDNILVNLTVRQHYYSVQFYLYFEF